MVPDLKKVLANVTPKQARVVLMAMDQFVENMEDFVEGLDEPDAESVAQLEAGRAVLDALNAEIAALAD